MTQLARYEAARAALAEARRVDEVKDIRDKAEAIRAYARMAKDVQLEMDAAELRLRAERRMGLLIAAEKQSGRLRRGPDVKLGAQNQIRVSLEELGIDKKLSSRAQKIAALPEPLFEKLLPRWRETAEKDPLVRRAGPFSDALRKDLNRSAPSFVFLGGDIRHWSRGKLKRTIAALERLDRHCGAADDAEAIGDLIGDAKLQKIMEGD